MNLAKGEFHIREDNENNPNDHGKTKNEEMLGDSKIQSRDQFY